MKGHAELRQSPFHEWRFHNDARQSDIARGLQIDVVEGCGKIVRAVARTKLTKSFRIRDGKFLVCAKSLDSIANLLGLGHAHRSRADLGNHADDAIVTRSAIDGIH